MEKIPNFFDVATPAEVKLMFGSETQAWLTEKRKEFAEETDSNLDYLARLYVHHRRDHKTADHYIDLIQDPDKRLDTAMSAYELDLSWMPD